MTVVVQDSGELFVRVVCTQESHSRYVVARMVCTLFDAQKRTVLDPDAAVGRFWRSDEHDVTDDGYKSAGEIAGAGAVKAFLTSGERFVTADEMMANPEVFEGGERHRFNFTCRECGLSLVAREEKLNPVLDRLVVVGVEEVSIAGLTAIV